MGGAVAARCAATMVNTAVLDHALPTVTHPPVLNPLLSLVLASPCPLPLSLQVLPGANHLMPAIVLLQTAPDVRRQPTMPQSRIALSPAAQVMVSQCCLRKIWAHSYG